MDLRGRPIEGRSIKDMTQAMAHRGPDDWGWVLFSLNRGRISDESYWVEARAQRSLTTPEEDELFDSGPFNFALGHCRLSIIDLTQAGHQPMSNQVNGIWLSYNGEIYNFQELREELKAKGHHFFSRTDSEVLIHLYEEHGAEFVHRLNGMFALALWDQRKRRLYLIRDRYGIKPLYYTVQGGVLLFASEIKAFLKYPGFQARLDERAFLDYFTFQNTYGKKTLFEGVSIMEPGTMIVVENGRLHEEKYWDFQFYEETDKGQAYYREAVREHLTRAVTRQLVADVPVGSYLSGGLDSGSITALAAQRVPRLMTFTGGFDVATAVPFESLFDERTLAELMSSRFDTEHYQMVIHAGDLEWALPQVIWHIEELRLGMCYPNYYLARLASKFVKVVLGGPGGDEVLAGYPWRYKLVEQAQSPEKLEAAYFKYWSRLISTDQWKNTFTEDFLARNKDYTPLDTFRQVMSSSTGEHPVKRALHFEAKTFLHGILMLDDKLSMAHSLESRVPLLDDEWVDLVTSIPVKYLINHDWLPEAQTDENLAGKFILRQAMDGLLPKEIVEGRKAGFSPPEQSWYQQKLTDYLTKVLLGPQSRDRRYFRPETLERVLQEHFRGQANHRLMIWSLLSFEWWNRMFIDG